MKCSMSLVVLVAANLIVASSTANTNNRIIGGQNANAGQFPYLAAIRTHLNRPQCGGCIISNRWILTAAHCHQGAFGRPENMRAAVGAHTLFDGIIHRLQAIITHPNYDGRAVANDVAVVLTATRIEYIIGRVQPARLPSTDTAAGLRVWIAGWGLTKWSENVNEVEVAKTLQFQQQLTISQEECRQRLGRLAPFVHNNVMCTLTPRGQGNCKGDSGGPLVSDQGVCVGLVSWGIPCGTRNPDAYTRVFHHLQFIYGITRISSRQTT